MKGYLGNASSVGGLLKKLDKGRVVTALIGSPDRTSCEICSELMVYFNSAPIVLLLMSVS